jgi:hypothetical protein
MPRKKAPQTTYQEDLLWAELQKAKWIRKLKLARTKCRKLTARITRLRKQIAAGTVKKPRRFPTRPTMPTMPVDTGVAPIV